MSRALFKETFKPVATSPIALTVREAASMLQISERCLWDLTKAGRIRSVKIGRLVRYYEPDLKAFMEQGNGEHQR